DERLMEGDVFVVRTCPAAGSFRIGAEHVVVDQQVREAETFRRLDEFANRRRVGTDLVMRKDDSVFHRRDVAPAHRVRKPAGVSTRAQPLQTTASPYISLPAIFTLCHSTPPLYTTQ